MAERDELLTYAREVAQRAYAPYSQFRVGAAVLDASGGVHLGCNVESASYGLTICAERAAIFGAISAGAHRPLVALAVTCLDGACAPCGACRQVITEHFLKDAPIYIDRVGEFTPDQLLPYAFELKE